MFSLQHNHSRLLNVNLFIFLILIALLTLTLISNAVTTKKERSILYSRISIQGLSLIAFIGYNNMYLNSLGKGIGIYNGLFNINILNQTFIIFTILLAVLISSLTSFYPRRLLNTNNLSSIISNISAVKGSAQFSIIEYALITMFVLSGAILLMTTGDLISLFLSIELQSYGLYILATLYRNSESSTNSGLTYFLLGGLSSCFILLGSAILYITSGTTNLDTIYIINSMNEYNIPYDMDDASWLFSYSELDNFTVWMWNSTHLSFIVLTVGLLFKISAAPFHFWSPDVYDGIPTIVTTFVAVIAKLSLLVIMLELVFYTGVINYADNPLFVNWKNILLFSSFMSLIIGSVLGLAQHRIKRLFAYSTISHVGFILLSLCINQMESIQGCIFYIMQYSLSNVNSFFILITIGYTLYKYIYLNRFEDDTSKELYSSKSFELINDKNKLIDVENSPIQLLDQVKGYFYINSFLSLSFAITLFSFVGIPPLIGFFAKQMVLSAALDQGFVLITLVGVVTSVIGAVYYLNIIKLMFFNKSDYAQHKLNNVTNSKENALCVNDGLSVIISVLTMLISLFIFVPSEWFRIVSIVSLPMFYN